VCPQHGGVVQCSVHGRHFTSCIFGLFRCCSTDGIRTTIPVGEECVININTADAGYGNVTCHIRSTSGSDVDIDIVDNGDGTVSILYTPRLPGAYTLNIKFGGQPVPKGQFTQQVNRAKNSFDVSVFYAKTFLSFASLLHRKYDHVTDLLRDTLHWLPIRQRVVFNLCTIVYKCLHGVAPSYLVEMCPPVSNVLWS